MKSWEGVRGRGGRARRRVANEHGGFARLAQCHPLSAGAKEGV